MGQKIPGWQGFVEHGAFVPKLRQGKKQKEARQAENIGKVIQVSGPAVDVQFEEATMPPIYQALRVTATASPCPRPST
jgi:hypothetical protein